MASLPITPNYDRHRDPTAPYLLMPPDAVPLLQVGSIVAPANGTQTIIPPAGQTDGYICPNGWKGVILGILCEYVGTGWVNGNGNIVWLLDKNRPLTGAFVPTSQIIQDLGNITTQRGSSANGPWPIHGGILFGEQDQLRWKVTTQAPTPVGGPNYIIAGFYGWVWPKH